MSVSTDVAATLRDAAGAGGHAARRADPLAARRLDRRQRLGPGARPRPAGHQALRRLLRRAVRGDDGGLRPRRRAGRGRARPVLRHRRARLRLPAHARGRRRRAHALDVRHRLGRPRRGDPVRAHDGGRRVRRRHPGRPVRADRRRLDRPRHRRDPARQPLEGGAHAEPRPVHRRQGRPRRGQGGGAARGRRPHRARRPPARRRRCPIAQHHVDALFDRYQNVYGQPSTPTTTTGSLS